MNICPKCKKPLISLWSGVKCSSCNYWFCWRLKYLTLLLLCSCAYKYEKCVDYKVYGRDELTRPWVLDKGSIFNFYNFKLCVNDTQTIGE